MHATNPNPFEQTAHDDIMNVQNKDEVKQVQKKTRRVAPSFSPANNDTLESISWI